MNESSLTEERILQLVLPIIEASIYDILQASITNMENKIIEANNDNASLLYEAIEDLKQSMKAKKIKHNVNN